MSFFSQNLEELNTYEIPTPLTNLGKAGHELLVREDGVIFTFSVLDNVISVWRGNYSAFQLALDSFRFPNGEGIPVCPSVAAAFHGLFSQLDQRCWWDPGGAWGLSKSHHNVFWMLLLRKAAFLPRNNFHPAPHTAVALAKKWRVCWKLQSCHLHDEEEAENKTWVFPPFISLPVWPQDYFRIKNEKKVKTKTRAFWPNFTLSISFIAQGRGVCG